MKRFSLVLCLFIFSCSSGINNISSLEQETTISSFSKVSLENKSIGQIQGKELIVTKSSDKYLKSELDSLKYIINEQDSAPLLDKKSYALVSSGNSFYVYDIKKSTLFSNTKDYQDLRNIKLSSSSDYKINAIISEKSKIRFFSAPNSNYQPQVAKSPTEIIARLKVMESDFSKTKDHRGVFASTYRVISERVDKEIQKFRNQNKVKSADFLEKLMLNFANKYFYAHDLYFSNQTEKAPEVWRMSFDSGRKAEINGITRSANIVEILALSMNAHIIHDLSFSLQEVNYDPNDAELSAVYDMFNKALFEEKDHIIQAINNIYGKNIISSANKFFGPVGDFGMQHIFNIMRGIAKSQSEFNDKNKIISRSVSIGDGIMKTVPGGNSL